uniref:ATP-dependent DNA helicase n=1 Tax=Nicotiana sylvestris TaxID=4096 RepID=A0A1U7Y6Y1_NICSY|nr:PREDICTED: uncharacterized protein LOC104241324 [Nicotiana sylvestris]
MTCNPSWPEIEEHLLVTDELQNRPDLISRVFRAKVEEMKIDILKRNIFGKVAAFVYTIEFQKHGLPHAHFLIILNNEYKLLTPEAYDKFVCAELPESDKNDYLYSLVTKHMMHGPCGSLNPKCPCMKNREYCKFKYPKEFTNHTYKGKNGYPIYRRRNNETKLNDDQRKAYDIILDRIFKNKCGAFFIDGPGGTGKTFLYRALLATVRSKGFVALATATSGVAASILSDGRTAHSHFKFPVDIDEHFSCNISKQSSLASLIRDAKLIVWDEVSMAKKQLIEAFDLLLKDLMDTKTLFGGKVVVFGGDFRQTLPVVRSEKKKDFLRESLLCFEIWNQLEKLRLSINMRARTDPAFSDYLMRIESGKEKLNYQGKIDIPDCFIVPFISEKESLKMLFRITYPDLYTSTCDMSSTNSRVILTTKNDFVDEINDMLITQFFGETRTYVAFDETIETTDQSQYEDFLHTLHPTGLPPYKLTVKINCPVILLWNLNPCEGLCNGTRLICCNFERHVISAKIASGDSKKMHVFIPRIPLLSSQDEKLPIPFKRTQFPIRLCFAN